MFEKFLENFKVTDRGEKSTNFDLLNSFESKDIQNFLIKFEGSVFNNGVYSIHRTEDMPKWKELVQEAFPEDMAGNILCFAQDWQSRQFVLELDSLKTDEPEIYLIDTADLTGLMIPMDFVDFHNISLTDFDEDLLSLDIFNKWLKYLDKKSGLMNRLLKKQKQINLKYGQSVGLETPLFLNGQDEFDNFEIVDTKFYWEFTQKIRKKVENLPEGTPIDSINFYD